METTSIAIDNLNDLIQIHNDRVAGYEKAIEDLKNGDESLKALFAELIGQSHKLKMELGAEIIALGGDIETETSFSGKIHRAWMTVKDAFGKTEKSVLENCEFGEDAIFKAYKTALEDDSIPSYLQIILVRQQSIIKGAHDKIKALRDSR